MGTRLFKAGWEFDKLAPRKGDAPTFFVAKVHPATIVGTGAGCLGEHCLLYGNFLASTRKGVDIHIHYIVYFIKVIIENPCGYGNSIDTFLCAARGAVYVVPNKRANRIIFTFIANIRS